MISPDSSTSIKTIVAVAARLISPFRQKLCHARRTLKATKATIQSSRW